MRESSNLNMADDKDTCNVLKDGATRDDPVRNEHAPTLGKGAYATVIEKGDDAIKCYTVPAETGLSCAYREIDMLSRLKHPHIIGYRGCYLGQIERSIPEGEQDGELHIVMERAECDMYKLIRSGGTSEEEAQGYIVDILLGVDYLHINGIIHRDLSIGNVLQMKNHKLAICDLGMAKWFIGNTEPNGLYVNEGYRSPEMQASSWHNEKMDIWSVGVILHCLLLGHNPFRPRKTGTTVSDALICHILKHIPLTPSVEVIQKWIRRCCEIWKSVDVPVEDRISSLNTTVDRIIRMRDRRPPVSSRFSEQCQDFLAQAMCFHVHRRASARELLRHPWLSSYAEHINRMLRDYNVPTKEVLYPRILISPHSSIREAVGAYIRSIKSSFAQRTGENRTNRLCLSLVLFYRLLATEDKWVKSDVAAGYIIPLYIVCLIISIKYYCTNTVASTILDIIPRYLRRSCNKSYRMTREWYVLNSLSFRLYEPTTYDYSVLLGVALQGDDRDCLWEYYLTIGRGEHEVKKEIEGALKKNIIQPLINNTTSGVQPVLVV